MDPRFRFLWILPLLVSTVLSQDGGTSTETPLQTTTFGDVTTPEDGTGTEAPDGSTGNGNTGTNVVVTNPYTTSVISPLNPCCGWARAGECEKNPWWMKLICYKECGIKAATCPKSQLAYNVYGCRVQVSPLCCLASPGQTGGADCVQAPAPPPQTTEQAPIIVLLAPSPNADSTMAVSGSPGCEDTNSQCADWAKAGECEKNKFWMGPNCQKSCDCCGGKCVPAPIVDGTCGKDENSLCPYWAANGECDKNKEYMHKNCAPSCKCPGGSGGNGAAAAANAQILPIIIQMGGPAAAETADDDKKEGGKSHTHSHSHEHKHERKLSKVKAARAKAARRRRLKTKNRARLALRNRNRKAIKKARLAALKRKQKQKQRKIKN